jgi:hypothetical protein|tara:strand:+ start:1981 stop:2562 length:582 start_codon:yes stop_codon:yes gene_type:complete
MSKYQFKTTNIRGKQYVEVNERIKFFRQEEQYKNWAINTEFPMLTADEALCRCTITDRDGMVVAVGHAHEVKAASNINKTSYVENCETSAVGRALAMLGIGIDVSIASANEVETAIEQQEEKPAPKKRAAKKAPAKKAEPKKEEPAPVDDIMDKAVNYVKGATDKRKSYDQIIAKYGDQLTEAQQAGLFKFVR